MKKLLLPLLLLISIIANSQVTVRGQVWEKSTNSPLEFADVVLRNSNSENLIGTITDSLGAFTIDVKSGNYRLEVTYSGHHLFKQTLSINNENKNLGRIDVENSQLLDEVTISTTKKMIERKVDRLIFNVENSIRSSSGNAYEVIKATPGLRVRNESIKMIGKSTLRVMIDDKIIPLSEEELSNFLKSIASEDIKSIEVITVPPAKYEASGNSGLINIKLKKGKSDSWNAQLRSSYLQRKYPFLSTGGNFNLNVDKLSISASLNYNNGSYYQEQDDYAYFSNGLWYTSSPLRARIEGVNSRLDLTYELTPWWEIGGQYLFNVLNYKVTDSPYTAVYDENEENINRRLKSNGLNEFQPKIHSVNFNNTFSLDTLGRKVDLNFDYFSYSNPDSKYYKGRSEVESNDEIEYFEGININRQNVENFSGKLDVELPLNFVSLNIGGKISNSKSSNDISFFNSGLVEEPVENLPLSQNDFNYDENIQALYLSFNKSFNDKWSSKIGLRMESTDTEAVSESLNFMNENDYTKIFPSFYLLYNKSDDINFAITYSKRIERPTFFQLNPNIYFINPFQTIEGNAFLQPSFIDNVEISNTYKTFHSKLYLTYEDNMFSQVPLPNSSSNEIRFVTKNFINTYRIGFNENYTFNKIDWWSSTNSFDINYSRSEFNLEYEVEDREGLNASISTYNDFNLNSEKTFLLGVNFWYNFPGIDGIFDTKSASSLSLSLQRLFLKKKLNVTLRGNDLFKSAAERTTTTINGVYQRARYYYDNRSIQLSVSYKFGNDDISAKVHQTGNTQEKGRTGN